MTSFPFTRRAALALLAAGAAADAPAQTPAADAAPAYQLPFSAVIAFTSALNGVDYVLYIRTPPTYAHTDDRYPVVVTLDADYTFPIVANHLEHLADRQDQAAPAIVVGVAYAGAYPDRDRYRQHRSRDYTPFFDPDDGYGPAFQAQSGGGPLFLRVLAEEVLPRIEAAYRTAPGARMLIGHSYGGLLGAWALQNRPDLFSHYLLVSPSLWYGAHAIPRAEAGRAWPPLAQRTRVFLAAGALEEAVSAANRMVSAMQGFGAALTARGDPNLAVRVRVFEDETHASIFPAAASTGLRDLFRRMDAPG